MTQITTDIKTAPSNHLTQWLFNPFRFMAGYKALLLGLPIILITASIAYLGNTHFDGVLDVHIGLQAPLWLFFAEGLINWICMAISLFFPALIVSRSSFRAVDVLGTQALARWPHIVTALVMLPDANRRMGEYFMSKLNPTAPAVAVNYTDVSIFVFAAIFALLMIVWMVALMYKAYAVSCNIKGAKAVITFIVGLIIAEVLSKLAIWLLITQSAVMHQPQ